MASCDYADSCDLPSWLVAGNFVTKPLIEYIPELCEQWDLFIDETELGWWGLDITTERAHSMLALESPGSVVLYEQPAAVKNEHSGSFLFGAIKTASKRVVDFSMLLDPDLRTVVEVQHESGRMGTVEETTTSLANAVVWILYDFIPRTLAKNDVEKGLVTEIYEGNLYNRAHEAPPRSKINEVVKELHALVFELKSANIWWGWLRINDNCHREKHNQLNLKRHLTRQQRPSGIAAVLMDYSASRWDSKKEIYLFHIIAVQNAIYKVCLDLTTLKIALKSNRKGVKTVRFNNAADVLTYLNEHNIRLLEYDKECADVFNKIDYGAEYIDDGKWYTVVD